jgi:putative transposase
MRGIYFDMRIFRSYKVEMKPNNRQRTVLTQYAGTKRFIYNWALGRRIEEYRSTGKASTCYEQQKQLTVLKQEDLRWLYEVSYSVQYSAIEDVDAAFRNFFRRVKSGDQNPGFPRFKSRKGGIGSFRIRGALRVMGKSIKLPNIGIVKLRRSDYIPVSGIKVLSATISERSGRWFISVNCEIDIPDPSDPTGDPIGIDLGIKTLAVVSDGRTFDNPKILRKSQKKLRRVQRSLSRKQKGSNNREETRRKLNKVHYRIANIRRDYLHKITSSIVKAKTKPSMIVLEDLNVAGMVKNHCLARAISDIGMSEFRRQIEYKAAWNGVKVVITDRFFPSSKTCHKCGLINDTLTLSDRSWICECGTTLDRDLNAAINLREYGIRTVGSTGINAYGQDTDPGGNRKFAQA